jgi:hypothetical protein
MFVGRPENAVHGLSDADGVRLLGTRVLPLLRE